MKSPRDYLKVCRVSSLDFTSLSQLVDESMFIVPSTHLSSSGWTLRSTEDQSVFEKIRNTGDALGSYVDRKMFYGIKTGFNAAFIVDESKAGRILDSSDDYSTLVKRIVGGQDIRRYFSRDPDKFLIVIPAGWTRKKMLEKGASNVSERTAWEYLREDYSAIASHLADFIEPCKKRQDKGYFWWELRPCDYYDHLDRPKIVFPDICKGPRFHLDHKGVYLTNTAYCLGSSEAYLLAILNSSTFWYAISRISIPFGVRAGKFRYRLIYQYMKNIPIRTIDFSDVDDKARHDEMVTLVERMLDLHKRLADARTRHDKTTLQRQNDATDTQIDRLVYDLYGLTEDEIKIVEDATK